MAQAQLNVIQRDETGKGISRRLRREGMIPAVVYGKSVEPSIVSVNVKDLKAAIRTAAGWNTLLTLTGAPAVEGKVVVLKDLDVSAISRDLLHADLQVINLKEAMTVMVPVVTVGPAVGEKVGGILQVIRHELEINCLPGVIPEAITVDVSAMDIGDVIHIEDIALPAGVEAPHDVNFTVVTLTGRKPEAGAEEGEEAAAEA